MTANQNLNFYNIQIPTSPLVKDVAKLIFTLEGTSQSFSEVYAKDLDERLPDIQLYQYQAKVFEAIKHGKNILVVSGTGSGKTEACFFPILCSVQPKEFCRILAVYPTNVLARQQQQRLQDYASWFGLNIHYWAGETVRHSEVPEGEIITTNPNFLLENFKSKTRFENFLSWFSDLETIIFDEIHMYTARQIALLTELLRIIKPKQIIFLSATVGNLQEVAQTISNINGNSTQIFRGSSQKAQTQYIVLPDVSQIDMVALFLQYLVEPGMTLIFTQSIAQADQLRRATVNTGLQTSFLKILPMLEREKLLNSMVTVHHSGLSPDERVEIEDRLKNGSMVVFSPKTLAQGIDVANVVRVVHIGLPNSLADFLQREGRAGRRKETQWTESIIFAKNAYDELILSNQATFEAYIRGTPERILLLPNSPVAELFRVCFTLTTDPEKLSDSDIQLLVKNNLIGSSKLKKLSKMGKIFWKEELAFYGAVSHITFLDRKGLYHQNPDRVSKEDIILKYQPNTLHYRYGVLQRVKEYQGTGRYMTPVFEIVRDQIITRLYKNNSLRSYVVKQVATTPTNQFSESLDGGIGQLCIRPIQVSISFLRTDRSPPEYEVYQTYPAEIHSVYLLTTFVTIPFTFSPINMEMAVHCLIQALRITQDIRYTEVEHALIGKMDDPTGMKMLLYESNFSGLLLHLNYDFLLETAKEIAFFFLDNQIDKEEIYPLPTCRYIKRKKDNLTKEFVKLAFTKIKIQLNFFKQ